MHVRHERPLVPFPLRAGRRFNFENRGVSYRDVFDTRNADIGAENSYFGNTNRDISTS